MFQALGIRQSGKACKDWSFILTPMAPLSGRIKFSFGRKLICRNAEYCLLKTQNPSPKVNITSNIKISLYGTPFASKTQPKFLQRKCLKTTNCASICCNNQQQQNVQEQEKPTPVNQHYARAGRRDTRVPQQQQTTNLCPGRRPVLRDPRRRTTRTRRPQNHRMHQWPLPTHPHVYSGRRLSHLI